MAPGEAPFTIRELAAQAAVVLAIQPAGRMDGRTREIADVRTLRYYTTLGLLDRPARWAGRTAYYGPRHLQQLVSIKRLQAKGLSLAAIQARLLNASSDELARLADLPPGVTPTSQISDELLAAGPAPAGDFWKARPAAAVAAPLSDLASAEARPESGGAVTEVAIEAGVALLFTAARRPDGDDLAALRVAALPLLDVLRKRRLVS